MIESGVFDQITVVSETQYEIGEFVEWVDPHPGLRKVFGSTLARLYTFARLASQDNYDTLGGFHLLLNGLLAIVVGARHEKASLYFCVGGAAEIEGGGVCSENRLFDGDFPADKQLESDLVECVQYADLVITMGTVTKEYFLQKGVLTRIEVNPGGVLASEENTRNSSAIDVDVLFVGRVAKIKNLPLLIDAVEIAGATRPALKVVVVGDGPELESIQSLVESRQLEGSVQFAGYQDNVAQWLHRARLLILTSFSEGLSLAVMEAIASGLPVICPDVGDLGDAVVNGVTGELVAEYSAEAFAKAILKVCDQSDQQSTQEEEKVRVQKYVSRQGASDRWRSIVSPLEEVQALCAE